ncbi:TetR family transcriptional regulator [Kitasatospora griseola]
MVWSSPRGHGMRKRAEGVERTRQRIVDAAVELHGTAGPASTGIAAVAERAGVTRLTRRGHPMDRPPALPGRDGAVRGALGALALAAEAAPPQEWGAIENPLGQPAVGLADIYRFHRAGEQMLTLVVRDQRAVPAPVREVREVREAREETTRQDVEVLTGAWPEADDPARRAAIGHAAAFSTWRPLCREQGLTDREAVELMVAPAGAVGVEC